MHQGLASVEEILKAAQKFHCELPLLSMDKYRLKRKYVQQTPPNTQSGVLAEYWAEFIKAQEKSTANYIFNNQTFSNVRKPILLKKKGVPLSVINQHLVHMTYMAGLWKVEIFYLLSFLLNLLTLSGEKQNEYMEYMLHRKFLDVDMLTYLQMISRHPVVNLTENQLNEFQQILKQQMYKYASTEDITYYNPEHIFLKSVDKIDPYELEYLNMILHSKKKLTSKQTLYLAKFVYKLQKMHKCIRQEYLKFLRNQRVMPFNKFEYLVADLMSRGKRLDQNKLKNLLNELQVLMEISPCVAELEKITPKIKKPIFKTIKLDYLKIHKALSHLMAFSIPNIVRVTDLKNFLKDMFALADEQIISVFNNLKSLNVMTPARFVYIENFIKSGKLGKVDKTKRKEFIKLLNKVAAVPVNVEFMFKLDIPASKGPLKEKCDPKAVEEVKQTSADLENKQEETETKQQQTENESEMKRKSSKESSTEKLAKKSKKKQKGK